MDHKIVTVCSYCKRQKNHKGRWKQAEPHHHGHGVHLSHGACPPCYLRVLGELVIEIREEARYAVLNHAS